MKVKREFFHGSSEHTVPTLCDGRVDLTASTSPEDVRNTLMALAAHVRQAARRGDHMLALRKLDDFCAQAWAYFAHFPDALKGVRYTGVKLTGMTMLCALAPNFEPSPADMRYALKRGMGPEEPDWTDKLGFAINVLDYLCPKDAL